MTSPTKILKGILAALLLLVLGCATQEEQPLKHVLYEKTVGSKELAVATAAAYLSRQVIRVESDYVRGGIYPPSAVESRISGECLSKADELAILNDRLGRTRGPNQRSSDPFADIPRELTYFEIRNSQTDPFPDVFQTRPSRSSFENECPRLLGEQEWLRDLGRECQPKNIGLTNDEPSELRDLDFIYVVEESALQKCRKQRSRLLDRTIPSSRDGAQDVGEREQNALRAALAAVEYDPEGIMRLLTLLPLKYRATDDARLQLPSRLIDVIDTTVARVAQSTNAYFQAPKLPNTVRITFNRNDVVSRWEDYGAWYQALTPLNGDIIYISPLLARAPTYLCFSHVYNYMESRYRLISHLAKDRATAWRDFSREDVISIANRHKDADVQYRTCVEAQLYFIVAHEIGHMIKGKETSSNESEELMADCYAYILSKRTVAFDLRLFTSLILNHKDAQINPLSVRRGDQLLRLEEHFKRVAPPISGEGTIDFCRMFSNAT